MSPATSLHLRTATLILDPEDRYARLRGVRGRHPRPIGPVNFSLVGQMAGPSRQDFPQPLPLILCRNDSGYLLFFGVVRAPDGTHMRLALDRGTYIIRAESRFYQRAERADIVLLEPRSPYLFDLAPGYAYPFPTETTRPDRLGPTLLRGSLHHTDGRGIVNVTIQAVGFPDSYTTDDTGQWVLAFTDAQSSGDVTIRFTFPDGTVTDVANVALVQGRESGLGETALRGWVLSRAGVGMADAAIAVTGFPGGATTGRDGGWFYYFGLNQSATVVSVTATLQDGRSLTQVGVQIQPRGTVVVPTFRFA